MRDKINDPARLQLMIEAIDNINEFVKGVSTYEDFSSNKVLCHAVVYNLQCIGENVYRLSREFIDTHPEIDWASIEGLRHVLVHDYYTVNMEMVWAIIQKDLPGLRDYLNNLE